MIIGARFGFTHHVQGAVRVQEEILGHKNDQDRAHAVETESLGGFVHDQEREAGRHTARTFRLGTVWDVAHDETMIPTRLTTPRQIVFPM